MKVFKEDTFDNEAGVFEMEAHHFSVGSQRVLKMLTLSVSYGGHAEKMRSWTDRL